MQTLEFISNVIISTLLALPSAIWSVAQAIGGAMIIIGLILLGWIITREG